MNTMTFTIAKSFGRLQLLSEMGGLRLFYVPIIDGQLSQDGPGACDILIPLEAVGGLWATARAFLYGVESLDENIILRASEGDILIKLYRDKPKGAQGSLTGEEICWMRIVSGRSEEERRRIKLGPRDLLSLELACNAVLVCSASPLAIAEGPGVRSNGSASEDASAPLRLGDSEEGPEPGMQLRN